MRRPRSWKASRAAFPLTVDQPPSADPGARALAQQQQRRQHADERLVVGKTDHPAGARLGEQPRGRIDVEQTAGAQVVRRKQVGHVIQRLAADEEAGRSEEHTSELQSLMRISYAVFCLKTTKTAEETKT